MKNREMRFAVLAVLCCIVLTLAVFPIQIVKAAGRISPAASYNLSIGLIKNSRLVVTDSGYMRVFYDKSKKEIGIEYYDSNFNIQKQQWLKMELNKWGGFYAGSDAYYIVEGQDNTKEKDSAEVIRVIKYDANWKKKGTAKITGDPNIYDGDVRFPFDYGSVEMTEYNGTLYIVTGHVGYIDSEIGQGHQGFLMIAVDEASMKGKIAGCDSWHSLAQYINCRDSDLYVLEQSEGSRCTKLSKYSTSDLEKYIIDDLEDTSISVFKYGGTRTSSFAIPCRATVDGMALSSENVLCLGTSIDQKKYNSSTKVYNIYLTVTPLSDFSEKSTTVKWLTNYSGNDDMDFSGTAITRINESRFMVSWRESGIGDTDILHYFFIDGEGNQVSEEFKKVALVSDCQPVVKGSKIVYYASDASRVIFYTINAETGKFQKKAVAGKDTGNKIDISQAWIEGLKESYVYTGKAVKPTVTVNLLVKKLKKGTDYTVSYSNNKNAGTATIKIKGINLYSGTLKKTFRIVKK